MLGCSSREGASASGSGGAQAGESASRSAGAAGQTAGSAGNDSARGLGGSQPSAGASGANAGTPVLGGASATGGSSDSGGNSGGDGQAEAGSGVTGVIAVGYGGLRVVSRDLGKTWQDETHWASDGKDDEDLLRTIAYGNGLWLSAGWRLVTSLDGVTWADHGMAEDAIRAIRCPVTDGLAFGAGKFLVACGSNLASSSDGLSWIKVAATPAVGGHPYLIWDEAEQRFVCSGDDGPSFVSDDGAKWTKISIDTAHLCDGAIKPKTECPSFHVQGVFLSTEWGGVIRRSSNGTSFERTYQDEFNNNLFTEYSFGVGRVAP